MAYEVTSRFWEVVDHWQTLIAGAMAVAAAGWTVWATIASAQREVEAAKEQTRAALAQTATSLRLERRRAAAESYAFLAGVAAAMNSVLEDATAARGLYVAAGPRPSADLYVARQRINKSGFAHLWPTFLRLGNPSLIEPFLRIEKVIDAFASGYVEIPTAGENKRLGVIDNFEEDLDAIVSHANELRAVATEEMARCSAVLADEVQLKG